MIDGELWLEDDQMPSCDRCMNGDHPGCVDLMWSEKYGTFACGCENPAHCDEEGGA